MGEPTSIRRPRGVVAYLTGRLSTIVLLGCMTVPLFYLLLDSYQVDFRAFYVAGTSASQHLNPYADNHQYGERFTDPINRIGSSRWVYPPSALFFIAPFARLSYTSARLIFGLFSLASLSWILLYLSGKFQVADSWAIACYVSVPVLACVERGQVDVLVLFLLVLTYACGRRFWAGVPLGIAISIKIFPAAILLWLLFQRRFREATGAVAVVALTVLLSVWRFGIAGYSQFRQNLASLGPGQHFAPSADPIHTLGGIFVGDRWLALTHGFIGSYNNPLVLFETRGVIAGAVLVVAAALLLHSRRVAPEVGFFTMVLVSQLINTRLWTMGMVMYLPICIVAIGKLRSTFWTLVLLVPLFLPAQVRVLGVSPRFGLALAVLAYLIHKGLGEEDDEKDDFLPDGGSHEPAPGAAQPLSAPVL